MKRYTTEIPQFLELCYSFYSNEPADNAVYPIADRETIERAVNHYLDIKPLNAIEFDSFDREKVREIIQPGYTIF
jgi:hypothetical protein